MYSKYMTDGVNLLFTDGTKVPFTISSSGYKITNSRGVTLFHHKAIYEIINGFTSLEVDHKNGSPADNRIENLREATRAQNARNRGKFKNSTSKYKGVSWNKTLKKWIAQLRFEGRTRYIGQFDDEYLAHIAWVAVAEKANGEFFRKE
jgi:hypothetical protein